jgi:hypothetical protein
VKRIESTKALTIRVQFFNNLSPRFSLTAPNGVAARTLPIAPAEEEVAAIEGAVVGGRGSQKGDAEEIDAGLMVARRR